MPNIAEGELTSLAFCWRIERADGAGLALTSHDEPVVHDGIAFVPAPGVTPSSLSRSLGLEPDSGEISGALSSDALTTIDLSLGRWNGAAVKLSAVNWAETNGEAIELLGGELGEVSIQGESFAAELRGAASRLGQPVCPSTSPECRAHFGDKRCRIDLAGRTAFGIVLENSGGEIRLQNPVSEAYLFGRLRYMNGVNCGLTTTITAVSEDTIRVRDVPRAKVESGCRVELREGCDKRLETCINRFANAVNFRGEPHLPGNDLLTRYPGA